MRHVAAHRHAAAHSLRFPPSLLSGAPSQKTCRRAARSLVRCCAAMCRMNSPSCSQPSCCATDVLQVSRPTHQPPLQHCCLSASSTRRRCSRHSAAAWTRQIHGCTLHCQSACLPPMPCAGGCQLPLTCGSQWRAPSSPPPADAAAIGCAVGCSNSNVPDTCTPVRPRS